MTWQPKWLILEPDWLKSGRGLSVPNLALRQQPHDRCLSTVRTWKISCFMSKCFVNMAMKYDDLYDLIREEDTLLLWLREKSLLEDFSGPCDRCDTGYLVLRKDRSYSKDGYVWMCKRRDCYRKISIREGSWFKNSHLTIPTILKLTYYWSYKLPNDYVKFQLGIGSDNTLVDWYNFAREVCVAIITEKDSELIGGQGEIVEIDESKFGKRKYHRGRRVDGAWVFGGVERDSGRCFFEVVGDRSADTLIPIIQKYIKPGTTIISDCWKAYSSLSSLNYKHYTVNHSKEFVNQSTGAHTNTIESTWHSLKLSIPKTGTQKSMYDGYFFEFVVRRKYLRNSTDKFLKFLELIVQVYTPRIRKPLLPVLDVSNTSSVPSGSSTAAGASGIVTASSDSVSVTTPARAQSPSLTPNDHTYWDTSLDLFD
jgi:transposase-like protein